MFAKVLNEYREYDNLSVSFSVNKAYGRFSTLYKMEKMASSRLLVQFEKNVDVIRDDGFAVVINPIAKNRIISIIKTVTNLTITNITLFFSNLSPTLSIALNVVYELYF